MIGEDPSRKELNAGNVCFTGTGRDWHPRGQLADLTIQMPKPYQRAMAGEGPRLGSTAT
jgi:hypothetical protein